jgi:hypothetical protein
MEIQYTLTTEDMIAYGRYHMDHPFTAQGKPSSRGGLLWLFLSLLLLVGVLLIITDFRPAEWLVLQILFGILGFLIGLILVFYSLRYRISASTIRRMLRQGQNHKLLRSQRLIITPEALTHITEYSQGTIQWRGVEKVALGEEHAFFYLNTTAAYVLPGRAFANDWEFRQFVETAQGYHERQTPLDVIPVEP